MQRVTTESGIKLLNFQLFGLQLLVAGGGVARRRFPLLAGFGAFNGYNFAHIKN